MAIAIERAVAAVGPVLGAVVVQRRLGHYGGAGRAGARAMGVDIVDTPALFSQVPGADRHLILADSARPETISHMRKHFNKRINPAVKGPGSIEEGIKFLQGYRILVHERCDLAIEHLENYKRKTDPKTGEILDVIEDAFADFPDALRYAVESDRRAPKAVPVVIPEPIASRW